MLHSSLRHGCRAWGSSNPRRCFCQMLSSSTETPAKIMHASRLLLLTTKIVYDARTKDFRYAKWVLALAYGCDVPMTSHRPDMSTGPTVRKISILQNFLCKYYTQQNKLDSLLCTDILGFSGIQGLAEAEGRGSIQGRLCMCRGGYLLHVCYVHKKALEKSGWQAAADEHTMPTSV